MNMVHRFSLALAMAILGVAMAKAVKRKRLREDCI